MSDMFGVGSAVSGVAQAAGTVEAASIAADASKHASDLQQHQYETTRGDLSPYNSAGQTATSDAVSLLPTYADTGSNYTSQMSAATPFNTMDAAGVNKYLPTTQNNSVVPTGMSEETLKQTPGYQWNLDQGLKATQSSAAARGLGVSGAAMKGAATYATGLADNTYQNQFNNLQTQFSDQYNKDNQNFNQSNTLFGDVSNWAKDWFNQDQTRFSDIQNTGTFDQNAKTNSLNRLTAVAGLGESAAAQTGVAGTQAASASGNYLTQGANTAANAITSGTNNLVSGINNYTNSQQQNSTLNKLMGLNSDGSSSFDGGSTVNNNTFAYDSASGSYY